MCVSSAVVVEQRSVTTFPEKGTDTVTVLIALRQFDAYLPEHCNNKTISVFSIKANHPCTKWYETIPIMTDRASLINFEEFNKLLLTSTE